MVANGTAAESSDGRIRFGLNFRPPYSREPPKREHSKRMSASGRFNPFAMPSGNDCYLVRAVVPAADFERRLWRQRAPDCGNSRFADILLRRTETWTIIFGDDEFDRREPCDRAYERRGRLAPWLYNQGGYPTEGQEFLFGFVVTH